MAHYDSHFVANLHDGWTDWPDLRLVYDYWLTAKGERAAPSWPEFDLLRLPVRLIPGVVVADYVPRRMDLRIRYWGTTLVTVFGVEATGTYVSDWKEHGLFQPLAEAFPRMAQTRRPGLYVNEFETRSGVTVRTPVLRMPLAADNRNIDGIVAVNDFSANKATLRRYFESLRVGDVEIAPPLQSISSG